LKGYPVPILPAPGESRLAELGPTLTRGLELIALRALGDADEARDAVQEILARAVEALRKGRVPADVPVGAFVHGIARHVVADAQRRRIRDLARVDSMVSPLPASQPSPLEMLILAEERDRLGRALAQLPAQDRDLLTRCFVNGDPVQRIAERSGVPADRLRKRKSRALERLRELLADRSGHVSSAPPISVA
jgi:RNA polymerase sigma-70 factor (ECF subfamily)